MMGKIPQGRDDLRQAWSQGVPQGRICRAMEKGGDGPLPLGFDIARVLILSPNFLAALLPLPDLSLKQCQRVVQPWAGMGGSPG